MKNNIEGLLSYYQRTKTKSEAAEHAKITVEQLDTYIGNPEKALPADIAIPLSEYFGEHIKFVLGYPYESEENYATIRKGRREDIDTADAPLRSVLEYKYYKGFYPDTNLSENKGTGFIAMSFNSEIQELCDIRKSFKKAIEAAGYTPIVADEIQSNNYITYDIIEAIDNCAFLVADTTYRNYGVYYEAGYANGQNKQVIFCCEESKFDNKNVHFDVIQRRHILWKSYEDLVAQLTERINKTVFIS